MPTEINLVYEASLAEHDRKEAFNLKYERNNILENRLTREGAHSQVVNFLGEYLTGRTSTEFSYELDAINGLTSTGWNSGQPIIESFRRAHELHKDDITAAEFISFNLLNQDLQDGDDGTYILISPDQGHGYSFITQYQRNQDGTVKATSTRVWNSDVDITHADFLNHIRGEMNATEVNPMPHTVANINSTVNLATQASVASSPSTQVLSMLHKIPRFPGDRDVDFSKLYFSKAQLTALEAIDIEINERLVEFNPQIEIFLDLLSNENVDMTNIEQAFSVMVLRAQVQFNREKALEQWGEKMVQTIEEDIITTSAHYLSAESQYLAYSYDSAYEELFLEIDGSCDSLKIGLESPIQSFIDSLSITTSPLSESSEPKLCVNCLSKQVISFGNVGPCQIGLRCCQGYFDGGIYK